MLEEKDVLYTAKLAKLVLSEDEVAGYQKNLSDILDYAKMLEEVDTENVAPLSHVLDVTNVMREDKTEDGLTIDEVLMNAPDKEGRCFKVPKML